MRIAQIAPLTESCPPALYGGTERVVSYLTEALVQLGHEVTLFASGDSITSARLVPGSDVALRLSPSVRDPLPCHMLMLDEVARRQSEFDVLHFHVDILHAPMARRFADKSLTTLHGRLDLPDLPRFYDAFPDLRLVSISHAQRRPVPRAHFVANVPHGLPPRLLPFNARPDGYLAFLGRIAPEKRPDRALEIAAAAGMPLKIAAKIDKVDRSYWDEIIQPMIRTHPNVEYIGEVNESEKAAFLGGAAALLFPIDWPEPFGLVMIEAMACGTPVIAWRCGSVPEVMEDGVTGFVVDNLRSAIAAVAKSVKLDRAGVRAVFDRRFTIERMARDYLDAYRALPGVGPQAVPDDEGRTALAVA